ncbi:4a-hydroxytetrahydrobiopterin dehydratase [Nocardia shimofusensis]|uniref:4a-hydroxytetrahydrobiopterin dehydratase n=1 Tax=Nocardia shimofusensis TaxID=228596 RepID=UPI00082CBBC7|nr:4a-hydroxytetrahydrobiopterin dehydratase [Nocardia shimofusensis]
MTAELLPEDRIATAMTSLPDWSRADAQISRTVTAASFPAAIDLVRRVADAAERANHHPDIDIRWRKVTFTLSTHSAGGLTAADFALAEQIDALVAGSDSSGA